MDENEFEFDGVMYEAIPSDDENGCYGCALDNNDLCLSSGRPHCHNLFRSDANDVIFVEKHP